MCPYLYYLMMTNSFYRSPQPPFGGPGSFPPPPPHGGPGGFPPPPHGGQSGGFQQPPGGFGAPPLQPPPLKAPLKNQNAVKFIDAGSIRFCRHKYTYIWLNNGIGFWMWIVYVGRNSIAGWRWNGRRWVQFGIDTRRIESFICF